MPGWWPLLVNRTFDFQPPEDHAGLAVLLRERILPTAGAGPGAEQATRVRSNHLAGEQPHVEFVHARFGGDIEIAERAQQTGRGIGSNPDPPRPTGTRKRRVEREEP